ncbi:MAG: methyltransferase domain-containing protein [Peptococcaceae bacterium]|nr:methyltransferase domain-containing protein [Peptococcaceae bacterium]
MAGSIPELRSYVDIFKCPVCGQKMAEEDLKRLFCPNGHSFDLSKDGYVNLLSRQVTTGYDKKMFTARRLVCADGFYNPLLNIIKRYIIKYVTVENNADMLILDVGCGEGSLLAGVVAGLSEENNTAAQGVGIDIAKEGIRMAAKYHSGIIWSVANLADMPFTDGRFPVVLNILSPANYTEFNRIMKRNGLLVKVLPGTHYLEELREALYHGTTRQYYSNKETAWLFEDNFSLSDARQVKYKIKITPENLEHIFNMTPLVWGASPESVERLRLFELTEVTVDLTIMAGKKKR